MKINDRYEIRVVVVEQKDGTTGDVYDNFKDFKREHPFSSYKFGYVVFDTEYGYIPDSCNDWNDSPKEAMFDYEENCEWNDDLLWRMENIMNNGLYHIQDNKIYKMSLDEPMKKIGTVINDEAIKNIIDTVTEYMYCNYSDCCMKEDMTWAELQKVRHEIKENAMEMIKINLNIKW